MSRSGGCLRSILNERSSARGEFSLIDDEAKFRLLLGFVDTFFSLSKMLEFEVSAPDSKCRCLKFVFRVAKGLVKLWDPI